MPAPKEPVTTRSPDDLRGALGATINTHSNDMARLAAMQIEATLLLVEAVDRLTDHVAKSAAAIDYVSDHLNEVGQPA